MKICDREVNISFGEMSNSPKLHNFVYVRTFFEKLFEKKPFADKFL